MTFDEYIQNPMGVANAVISNREMYRNMYKEKLDKIMVREAGSISYELYKSKQDYYCYMKIPSEVIPKFYYDVVIKFIEPKENTTIAKIDRTLKKYDIEVYANDPSFVYTFAHAFIKNKIFIDRYKDKMSSLAVKKNPDIKNPQNQIGYVKSLYFAFLLMSQKGLFNKIRYIDSYNESNLKGKIMNASQKIELREEEAKKISDKNRREKKRLNRDIKNNSTEKGVTTVSNKFSNRITTTKSINKIKSSNRVKTSKRI